MDRKFPTVDELLAFILRFVQDGQHKTSTVQVPVPNQDDYVVLFGLIQRVRRLTQAYMKLRSAGMGSEGQAVARAALEHAVTAQWAYLTPRGVARLSVTLARSQRDVADQMRQFDFAKGDEWDDAYNEIMASIPKGKGLPPFHGEDGMMAELDDVKFLSLTYKLLSQVSHVSYDAATAHVTKINGEVTLKMDAEDELDHPMLYALAGFGLLASWIQARLEGDEDEVGRLEAFGQHLHVPHRLDTPLPKNRRRFPDE
jgi:hypothetical protein